MNIGNKTAKLVGVLFLIAIATSLIGGTLLESILAVGDLTLVAENSTKLMFGVYLELTNAVAVVIIGILMFPLLYRYNKKIAVGYLGFRIIESVFCTAIVIGPLSVLTISKDFVSIGQDNVVIYQSAAILAKAQRTAIGDLPVLIFFCLGAFVLYLFLYRTKLLPRFISAWGLIAVVAIFIVNILNAYIDIDMIVIMSLALPIILNEIFMGVWLIVKGFNRNALQPDA